MPQLTRNQMFALAGFVIVLIAIPISFYLVKQTQIFRSKATSTTTPGGPVTSAPTGTGAGTSDLLKQTEGTPASTSSASTSTQMGTTFGPTLNMSIAIEGRPTQKQADKLFVGLAAGSVQINPSYILTFTVDLPDSGIFTGLSLAGLSPGSSYTAYVKGTATIDSSSTFTMSATETLLNDGNPLNLTAGDLNEDNTINSADYAICRGLYGTTPKSANWNQRADFNRDNIVNNYDLAFITKNMGKTGTAGPWVSAPKVSTSSASLTTKPNVGGPPADFGAVLDASTNSASVSEEAPAHSAYWIMVP